MVMLHWFHYMQALLYHKYTVQSDVWSYGCVLYEVWSLGHKPFENKSTNEVATYSYTNIRILNYIVVFTDD